MLILAGTIVISLTQNNVISSAKKAVDDTNEATFAEAAALKYLDLKFQIEAGTSPLAPGQTVGEYIEQELINDNVIAADNIIFFNNQGGLEKTVIGDPTDWTYTVTNNKAKITGYNKYGDYDSFENKANLVIPNVIDGKKVEIISGIGHMNLGSLNVSYGIKEILGNTFFENYGLQSVTLPNSLTTIGAWGFYGCIGLTSITLPNSLTTIGEDCFAENALTDIIIPSSVTSIGARAFRQNYINSLKVKGPERTFSAMWNASTYGENPDLYPVVWNY